MNKLKKNKLLLLIGAVLLVVLVVAGTLYLFSSNRNQNYAARVNGVGITKLAFTDQFNQIVSFYKQSNQTVNEQAIKQSVLDDLINKQLVTEYAQKNNIVISQEQIDAYYNQRASSYKSEQEFLATLTKLYGTNKEQYKATLAYDLLSSAVQQKVRQPLESWLQQQRQSAKITVYIKL